MAVTAKMVKELREMTGAGMMAVSYTHPEPTRRYAISYAVFCLNKKKFNMGRTDITG